MNAKTRLSFGLSGFADNALMTCVGVHLFMFYTDVIGLSPLWVSAGLTVAILWDAISDLAMGRISDRTRLRAGRRRPYILLGAIPVGASFAMLLSPPASLEGSSLGIYFTVSLLLLFTAKTIAQVPALALLPELAREPHERTLLSAAREQLGNLGDLAGLLLPVILLMATGAADEGADAGAARSALTMTGLALGGLASLALLLTFLGTHEDTRLAPPRDVPVREVFAALRANQPFRTLLVSASLAALALAFVQSMFLYVLTHVMQERDPAMHLGAFTVNVAAALASYPLWTRWSARVGKANAFRTGLGLSSLAFGSVFFVGPGDYLGLACIMAFSGAANVGFWVLLHSLNADITDLDEARHGERREGLFAGFAALVRKVAGAGAAAAVGLGLWLIGYQEHVTPSAQVVFRLELLFAIPTTILVLMALYAFRRYEQAALHPASHAPPPSSVSAALDPAE